jgi:hypothetical protein
MTDQEEEILLKMITNPRMCWLDRRLSPWESLKDQGWITITTVDQDYVRAFITDAGREAVQ